jgi:hypothetical protein
MLVISCHNVGGSFPTRTKEKGLFMTPNLPYVTDFQKTPERLNNSGLKLVSELLCPVQVTGTINGQTF